MPSGGVHSITRCGLSLALPGKSLKGQHPPLRPARSTGSSAPIPAIRWTAIEPLSEISSVPVAPAERADEAAELLDALLAVQNEGWQALAAAMSDELFAQLKRWHALRVAKDRQQLRSGVSRSFKRR